MEKKSRLDWKSGGVIFHFHNTKSSVSAFYVKDFSNGILHSSVMEIFQLPGIHLSCFA